MCVMVVCIHACMYAAVSSGLPVLVEADENGTPISRETTFTFDPASGQPCSDPLPPLCDSVVGGAEDHPLTPTTSLCSLHKEPL